MSAKFPELVFKQIIEDRPILVVDDSHSYAKIEQRVKLLWDSICAVGTPSNKQLDGEILLPILVGIASMTQHCAESLGLVEQQECEAREIEQARIDAKHSEFKLKETVKGIITGAKEIKAVQLGSRRFSFEFGEDELDRMVEIAYNE